MEKVYIVTHGAVVDGPDPFLSEGGIAQIKALTPFLPRAGTIHKVVVGDGRRHEHTFNLLFHGRRRVPERSSFLGVREVLVEEGSKRFILFPRGNKIALERYQREWYPGMLKKAREEIQKLFLEPGQNAVVIGSRLAAIAAGIPEGEEKSGALYVFSERGELLEQHVETRR